MPAGIGQVCEGGNSVDASLATAERFDGTSWHTAKSMSTAVGYCSAFGGLNNGANTGGRTTFGTPSTATTATQEYSGFGWGVEHEGAPLQSSFNPKKSAVFKGAVVHTEWRINP